jgi:hypothetical protein
MSNKINEVLQAARAADRNPGDPQAFERLRQMFNALTPEEKDEFGRRAAKQVASQSQLASLPKDDGMLGDRYA